VGTRAFNSLPEYGGRRSSLPLGQTTSRGMDRGLDAMSIRGMLDMPDPLNHAESAWLSGSEWAVPGLNQ
jgi:hypothetical protein